MYKASPDGGWREEPIASVGEPVGELRSRDQLEYLADLRAQQVGELEDKVERLLGRISEGEANGVALSSLVRIVSDGAATVRQRIRAAAAVLNYKVQDDTAEFVKKYLTSVCESADVAIDYRIEAGELLRKHESPKIAPSTIRPDYRDDTPAEPPVPLLELVRQRRERADRMQREALEREMAQRVTNGNGSDEH